MTNPRARPCRSALYMPASNARALEKSKTLAADILIFDLEDAVGEADKKTARGMAAGRVAGRGESKAGHVIRVNGLETGWAHDDLDAAARVQPDAILIPKIETGAALHEARRRLSAHGFKTPLWATVETPLALMNLRDIAGEAEATGCSALVAGTNDLASDLHADPGGGRVALLTHLAMIVAAARAYELIALDGVFNDLEDTDGLASEARQGRALGFDGKTLIHPNQIEAANAAFAPSEAEIAWAEAVAAAFNYAANRDKGVLRVEGKMVERLHLKRARRILAACT